MQYNWITKLRIATAILISAMGSTGMAASPEAHRGQDVFEKRCTGCHSLDKTKVGPALRGVYGRKAGADGKFVYSDALKSSSIIWNDSALDRWLFDTESLVPGNDMSFRLNKAEERADIIAYLKELSGK